MQDFQQYQLDDLYSWVDTLELSRPKRNIARDFSDAAMMAEVVSLFFPKMVDLHNYPATSSVKAKLSNWLTLNTKLTKDHMRDLANSVPFAIQKFLLRFKERVAQVERDSPRRQKVEEEPEDMSVERSDKAAPPVQTASNKLDELKDIYRLLRQKIQQVESCIRRKDQHIRQLEQSLGVLQSEN